MAVRWNLLILGESHMSSSCNECVDMDGNPGSGLCGMNSTCLNTEGSYFCKCFDGFRSVSSIECEDIEECLTQKDICGPNAECKNTIPHYSCTCKDGFNSTLSSLFLFLECCFPFQTMPLNLLPLHTDVDECKVDKVCDQNATCINTLGSYPDGHHCACHAGFTNYGNNGSRCTGKNTVAPFYFPTFITELSASDQLCLLFLSTHAHAAPSPLLWTQTLLSVIDNLLSGETFSDNRKVSIFLDLVENTLKLIGPFMKPPGTKISSNHTADLPQGAVVLSSMQTQLDMQMATAAGDPSSYPGFTAVSLLSYANLEGSAEGFYSGMKPKGKERFQINSKVVTVSVSNTNTSHLQEPIKLTFNHLEKVTNQTHVCVFWNSSEEGGTWSDRGCRVVESNPEYTVCSCNHLSSFAVLMALYDLKDRFELELISWVGLSLSLICLFICILTFWFIRSIHNPRTTIHLHLCISLFIANLIFLAGISRTENPVGCAVVAGLLHFFFLAAFCWMCLEGIQLFRMVILVFNTNFKTLYMMAGGYGVPAVIVAISALVNAKGYGTDRHCWLKLDFIWSFFGPACVIIIINIFFFLMTVWKLAQKFSRLHPDLDNLQKIKAFTITAVAQLCVLGTMWIFGCFQFEEGSIVMSYLFTIFGSFQGVMLFVNTHVLFCTYTESSSFQLQQSSSKYLYLFAVSLNQVE
uniref:Si:ch211-241f5.3 n=1 Tax=Labrus bergylta TaxID=56723 RepID=A0A3Q3GC82_9LABR